MTADVNPVSESSTLRQAQTALTEQRILAAATELFLADGYVATTLEAVARGARVAARTVYVRFGTRNGPARPPDSITSPSAWPTRPRWNCSPAGWTNSARPTP